MTTYRTRQRRRALLREHLVDAALGVLLAIPCALALWVLTVWLLLG